MIHVILPVQHLRNGGERSMEPVRRLMAAVLQTAVDDFRGSAYRVAAGFPVPRDRRVYEQAKAYVASSDRSWPFSFENLCEAIGLDAGDLRDGLSRERPT
jgi:hypothetical protein